MNVTKRYTPPVSCNGSRVDETVQKDCGYCVSTTGSNKFFHILFHDTNGVIDTSDGGHTKLAYHQDRVIIPYNDAMFIEHELERVVGFGDTSAIYYIKETTGSTYAKVDRSNRNLNESSLTWVSDRDSATQFVITNDGLLLQESGNVPKRGTNSWMKMLKTQGNTVMTQPLTTPLLPTGTSYDNSKKQLSQVLGPIRLVYVHVNASSSSQYRIDNDINAAAVVTKNGSNTLFTSSPELDTRCIDDGHTYFAPHPSDQYLKAFGKEIFDTGVITDNQQTDTITSAISRRLSALPYANSDIFGLEYDVDLNAYYLYYMASDSMPKFYLTGRRGDIACFKNTKTNEARLAIDEISNLPLVRGSFNGSEVWKQVKGYKIKFKEHNSYLDAHNGNGHAFSMSKNPFLPYFVIISLNDGQMYPSKLA
eukprot:1178077-Prorocentrum_minimum.AAC.1